MQTLLLKKRCLIVYCLNLIAQTKMLLSVIGTLRGVKLISDADRM